MKTALCVCLVIIWIEKSNENIELFSLKLWLILKTRSIQFPCRKWNVYESVWWQFQYTHRYRTKNFVWVTWNCCVRRKRTTYVCACWPCKRTRRNDRWHVVDCGNVIHGVMWLAEWQANGMNTADASTHQCFNAKSFCCVRFFSRLYRIRSKLFGGSCGGDIVSCRYIKCAHSTHNSECSVLEWESICLRFL